VSQSKTPRFPYRIQVLDRTLELLRILGERDGEYGLAELCAELKLHKSTVHRLIMVLEHHRLIERSPSTGRYQLGLRLFELGSKAMSVLDLREHSRRFLARILDETQETVHFCLFDQGEILYVEKLEPRRSVRLASRVGRRVPAYCTSVGKAMLAQLPEPEVETILRQARLKRLTKNTITKPQALKAELSKIRTRGYAIDDEENEQGVRCVGAVVWDHTGRPRAAISVSGPSFRMTQAKMSQIAKVVVRSATALSQELGYVSPELSAGRKRAR
jgi:IclR family transcriptional regulator, KDG regulon repressor